MREGALKMRWSASPSAILGGRIAAAGRCDWLGVLRVLRVLWVVRVVVWRRQALGRVGVMLLGECGQQFGWANK